MNKMELAFFEEQYNSAVSLRDKYFFRTVRKRNTYGQRGYKFGF